MASLPYKPVPPDSRSYDKRWDTTMTVRANNLTLADLQHEFAGSVRCDNATATYRSSVENCG